MGNQTQNQTLERMITKRKTTYTFAGNDRKTGLIRTIEISADSLTTANTAAAAKLKNHRLLQS